MKLTVRFDAAANLRVQTLSGDVTAGDLRAALTELYEKPEIHPDQRSIWDLREANVRGMSAADVQQIADPVSGSWAGRGVPRNALVASEDLVFGLSRMYEARLGGGGETRVFRDMSEALSWLSASDAESSH